MSSLRLLTAVICLLVIFTGCSSSEKQSQESAEILVFCGITMIDPIMELSAEFEKTHPVIVKMTYGGSLDLAKSIEVNKLGDIYFPGTKKYVDEMEAKGHIVDSSQVGFNQIAFFVQKGNHKEITGSLENLKNPELAVAIGQRDFGSVGREAHRILDGQGLYDSVVKNAALMASDSKGMTAAIKGKRVDLVMNWRSVYFLKDNADFMDEIPIEGGVASKHPLVMATLVHSKNPDMAKAFMDLCASEQGRAVFERFGF